MKWRWITPAIWLAIGAMVGVLLTRQHPNRDVLPNPVSLDSPELEDRNVLDAKINQLHLDRVPLPKAIAALADTANISVAIDWRQLDNEVGRVVTLDLRNVTIDQALESILQTKRYSVFSYAMHEGVLCIGSEMEGWPRENETRAYDVRQLIDDYLAYDLHPSAPGDRGPVPVPTPKEVREAVNRFAKLLDMHFGYYYVGGEITEFAGRLFITAPRDAHVKIRRALDDLRQVSRRPGGLNSALGSRD